jgi:hypothetical protein
MKNIEPIRSRHRIATPLNFRRRWILLAAWIVCYHEDLIVYDGRYNADSQARNSYNGGWNMFACAQILAEDNEARQSVLKLGMNRIHLRAGAQQQQSSREVIQTFDQSENKQLIIAAFRKGFGGGLSGALAGIVQVLTLMWLRTIMTYQLRYGTSFSQSLHTLLRDGGIARLYRGLPFGLIQAPLCRFVSTAANDGVNLLLGGLDATKSWGPGRKVAIASLVVGFCRMMLMRKYDSALDSDGMISTKPHES